MTDLAHRALLPAGLRDILPPHAAFEAGIVERLLRCLHVHGYERVKPPLVEFEETLLAGSGAAMGGQIFRLMDPVSRRMMGVRADMTLQVARIATTRLADLPRPLRLSYGGQVLRVKGSQMRPERQFGQVGVELIGSQAATADAEVILLAVEALREAGVAALSVDVNIPTLVPAVFTGLGLSEAEAAGLRQALDRKDAATVDAFGGEAARVLGALLRAAGSADAALAALANLDLPHLAAIERERLAEVAGILRTRAPDLQLTVDPVESRGFEYHTGVGFTVFSPSVGGELGSGGRYLADGEPAEPATGFTLFMDTVLRALPEPESQPRLFLPFGTTAEEGRRLRSRGWITLEGLVPTADAVAEASRINCTHAWVNGAIAAVPAAKGV